MGTGSFRFLPLELAPSLTDHNGATVTLSGTLSARVPRAPREEGCHAFPTISGDLPMKLKPLGDRLLVKPLEEEETTASGLVIPDTAKEKPQKGKVLAVGDGKLE